MGQKVNPIGMRLQVNRTWDSRWYAEGKNYGNLLLEDLRMREFIREECKAAGVSRVLIERPHKKCRVTIHTARPGVIIGQKGPDIEAVVDAADIDVVHIEQQMAIGAAHQLRNEFPFAQFVCRVSDIARYVFEQNPAAEKILHLLHAIRQMPQRRFGVRHRQQIVQIVMIDARPAQVIRNPAGLHAVDQSLEFPQVAAVERVAAHRCLPQTQQGALVLAQDIDAGIHAQIAMQSLLT